MISKEKIIEMDKFRIEILNLIDLWSTLYGNNGITDDPITDIKMDDNGKDLMVTAADSEFECGGSGIYTYTRTIPLGELNEDELLEKHKQQEQEGMNNTRAYQARKKREAYEKALETVKEYERNINNEENM